MIVGTVPVNAQLPTYKPTNFGQQEEIIPILVWIIMSKSQSLNWICLLFLHPLDKCAIFLTCHEWEFLIKAQVFVVT
uniref:Uncharacterized protein n=1 Tax=Tolypothrix bouteillei VB521301 TaxID=1479485 RepID=A0A0C1RAD4_9CYAN